VMVGEVGVSRREVDRTKVEEVGTLTSVKTERHSRGRWHSSMVNSITHFYWNCLYLCSRMDIR
jgi:hypothetical protein